MVRAMIPTMKKYPMALTMNHFAVVSACTGPRACAAAPGAVLTARSCILAPGLPVDAADEVHDVSDVVLRQPVVDPRGHGSALHAVENRLEQAPVGGGVHEERIAQVARPGHDIEGVGSLAVGLAAVAPRAALHENGLAVRRGGGR